MDRRTLLAMGLLFLLFMTWSKVYTHFYGPDPAAADSLAVAAPTTVQVETKEPGAAPAKAAADDAFAGDPARDLPAMPSTDGTAFRPVPLRTLTVTTDLYRLTVSTDGGQITSWEGLEYPGLDSEHVQLIPEPGMLGEGRRGDALLFANGTLDVAEASFALEGPADLTLQAGGAARSVDLVAETEGGLRVRKTLTFTPGRYAVGVRYAVETVDARGDDLLRLRLGDPVAARFAWSRGIAHTEADIKAMMRAPNSNRTFAMVGDELAFRQQAHLERDDDKAFGSFSGSVRFAGLQSKYFSITGFVPDGVENAVEGRIRLGGDRETHVPSWEMELPLRPDAGGAVASNAALYIGPNDFDRLRSYGVPLEKSVNLGWQWIQPISELVLRLMNWLHGFIPNYGWVIVIISILSKLVFWPLTARGTKAMRKTSETQSRLKPQMDELKRKYGKDPQRYNQEMMELYKREGVNPMAGMAGCLPMLIQMPVFFALYQVLYNMVDLRMAPWILWVNDLSQPDMLFTLPVSLPLFGSGFNLLPLIMAAVTFLQTKLTPQTAPGNQMAAMNNIMPIMMLFFLYNMPSGLVIYWTINTAMTALQSWMVNRNAPATGGASAA